MTEYFNGENIIKTPEGNLIKIAGTLKNVYFSIQDICKISKIGDVSFPLTFIPEKHKTTYKQLIDTNNLHPNIKTNITSNPQEEPDSIYISTFALLSLPFYIGQENLTNFTLFIMKRVIPAIHKYNLQILLSELKEKVRVLN